MPSQSGQPTTDKCTDKRATGALVRGDCKIKDGASINRKQADKFGRPRPRPSSSTGTCSIARLHGSRPIRDHTQPRDRAPRGSRPIRVAITVAKTAAGSGAIARHSGPVEARPIHGFGPKRPIVLAARRLRCSFRLPRSRARRSVGTPTATSALEPHHLILAQVAFTFAGLMRRVAYVDIAQPRTLDHEFALRHPAPSWLPSATMQFRVMPNDPTPPACVRKVPQSTPFEASRRRGTGSSTAFRPFRCLSRRPRRRAHIRQGIGSPG